MKTTHILLPLWLALICVSTTTVWAQIQAPSANGHKPGSLLFYNIHTSNAGNFEQQNTRLNITNTSNDPVIVHWFFVDSGSCTAADTYLCLTGNQTASLLSSDYDPGVTGYALAVAVNALGQARDFDFLIGTEYVKFATGHQANLPAEAITMFDVARAAIPVAGAGGTMVDLVFDDAGYEQLPFDLALNNLPSMADSNNSLLILNHIGGDLGDRLGDLGMLNGLLYNSVEKGFSFSIRTSGCQVRATLSDTFLRTSPPLSKVISTGSSGWIRLFTSDRVDNTPLGGASDARAMLGAMINFNVNAQTTQQAFNQGHNLHRLRNAPFTRLRMPVLVPPGC